jgi:hypothetical protein
MPARSLTDEHYVGTFGSLTRHCFGSIFSNVTLLAVFNFLTKLKER